MENDTMQEYIIEKYKQQLVANRGFDVEGKVGNKSSSCCIVLCKRLVPHLFDIKKGIAVVKQEEDCLDNGDYLVMNPAKVIFMLE